MDSAYLPIATKSFETPLTFSNPPKHLLFQDGRGGGVVMGAGQRGVG